MFADDSFATAPYGEFAFVTLIIPEVGLETKEVVIVLEIDVVQPAAGS